MRGGIVTLAALLSLFGTLAMAQNGNDLFQQAQKKVYEDHDFEGAIQVYDRILREFASDRALVARVTTDRVRAKEFLSRAEARKGYEQAIRDFADQPEVLDGARKRLAEVAGGPEPRFGIFIAQFDQNAGVVHGPVVRFTEDWEKQEVLGVWSPDGKSLALRRGEEYSIVMRSIENANETVSSFRGDPGRGGNPGTNLGQVLINARGDTGRGANGGINLGLNSAQRGNPAQPPIPPGNQLARLKWSHDGNGVLVYLHTGDLYRVDTKGNAGKLFSLGNLVGSNTILIPVLSPNDTTLYVLVTTGAFGRGSLLTSTIVAYDLAAGQSKPISSLPVIANAAPGNTPSSYDFLSHVLNLSPDGSTLALIRRPPGPDSRIALIRVDGGDYREILVGNDSLGALVWTKDGRNILFAKKVAGSADDWQVMQIPATGGEPVFTGLEVTGLNSVDFSPDGSRMAFDGTGYRLSGAGAPIGPQKQRP